MTQQRLPKKSKKLCDTSAVSSLWKKREQFLIWVKNINCEQFWWLILLVIIIKIDAEKICFRRYLHADSVETERHVVQLPAYIPNHQHFPFPGHLVRKVGASTSAVVRTGSQSRTLNPATVKPQSNRAEEKISPHRFYSQCWMGTKIATNRYKNIASDLPLRVDQRTRLFQELDNKTGDLAWQVLELVSVGKFLHHMVNIPRLEVLSILRTIPYNTTAL